MLVPAAEEDEVLEAEEDDWLEVLDAEDELELELAVVEAEEELEEELAVDEAVLEAVEAEATAVAPEMVNWLEKLMLVGLESSTILKL